MADGGASAAAAIGSNGFAAGAGDAAGARLTGRGPG